MRADQLDELADESRSRSTARPGPARRGRSAARSACRAAPCPRPASATVIASRFGALASTIVTARNVHGGVVFELDVHRFVARSGRVRGSRASRLGCSSTARRLSGSRARRRRESAPLRRAAAASPRDRCAAAAARAMRSRRSSDSARCAPRFVDTSAWISSMITVSTERRLSRAFDVSSRYSDSGVVIRMSAGVAQKSRALGGRRVAGAHGDRRRVKRDAFAARDVRDADERRAQIALDVDGQRLQRRDVQHAAALARRGHRLEHQPVQRPEKRRQRLAAAGRREDQRRLAARDRRPAALLRRRRLGEHRAEPFVDRRHEIDARPADARTVPLAAANGLRYTTCMDVQRKLAILADAAKYDASCASSGSAKRDSIGGRGMGSTEGMGICHSYAPDGRCISLLRFCSRTSVFTTACTASIAARATCRARGSRRRSRAAHARLLLAQLHRRVVPCFRPLGSSCPTRWPQDWPSPGGLLAAPGSWESEPLPRQSC